MVLFVTVTVRCGSAGRSGDTQAGTGRADGLGFRLLRDGTAEAGRADGLGLTLMATIISSASRTEDLGQILRTGELREQLGGRICKNRTRLEKWKRTLFGVAIYRMRQKTHSNEIYLSLTAIKLEQ